MDILTRFKNKYEKISKSYSYRVFTRFGAPMFVFVIGGSLLIEEFQKVRQDYIKNKNNEEIMNRVIEEKGLKINMRQEYEKIQQADTSNYRNIRGPRLYEDNKEFLKNREMQERRLKEILEGTSSGNPTTSR